MDERLIGDHFLAIATSKAVLVKLVRIDFHELRSRRDRLIARIQRTSLRKSVGVTVCAVGDVVVDEELALSKRRSTSAAEEAVAVERFVLEADPAVGQRLAALLTLFGDVLVVASVAVEQVLMVDESLGTCDVRFATLALEAARVIFHTFVFSHVGGSDDGLPAPLAIPNRCHCLP